MQKITYPQTKKSDFYKKNYEENKQKLAPKYFKEHKPIILNSNLVPQNIPKIYVGNHRHMKDQYQVIISQEEIIHWLSKAEYFMLLKLSEYYKNTKEKTKLNHLRTILTSLYLWQQSKPFKELLENTGAIPTERGTKNAKLALTTALEFLSIGESVGLFPESSRNTKETPINLDEWKQGAAIMAHESNAPIQIFVGNGRFDQIGKPPITLYSEPFDKAGMSIEATDKEIQNIMIERYLELKKIEKIIDQNQDLPLEEILPDYHILKKIPFKQ